MKFKRIAGNYDHVESVDKKTGLATRKTYKPGDIITGFFDGVIINRAKVIDMPDMSDDFFGTKRCFP